jgi:hypothetical protein
MMNIQLKCYTYFTEKQEVPACTELVESFITLEQIFRKKPSVYVYSDTEARSPT